MDCEVIVNRHDMYISLYISLLLGELTPSPAHRHALYGSRRVTEGHWLCTASLATHAVLGSLYESYRGFVSYRNQYSESGAVRCHTETYW